MSYKPFCDLCEKPIDGEPAQRGTMNRYDYCEPCAAKVDVFIEARNDLHDRIVTDWDIGLKQLIENGGLENAKLPD